jgi:hypothetical protein
MESYLTKTNNKIEIEFSLPSIVNIKQLSSIDRFGFSDVLRSKLKINFPYRTFCNWQQGWFPGDSRSLIEEDFVVGLDQKNITYITSHDNHKVLLERLGYKNVMVGGLPFCYINKPKVDRIKNSTLFMLPKFNSTCSSLNKVYSSIKLDNSYDNDRLDFIKYINSIKHKFDRAVVCIFPPDADSLELIELCKKHKLEVVLGAHPSDKNALLRMALLFSQFEYCISNWISSHIIYSNIMGAKCCVMGDFIEYKRLSRDGNWLYGRSEEYFRKKYEWLFVDDYTMSKNQKEWAKEMVGYYCKLQDKELVDALGWSFFGQLKGFTKGIVRRITQFITWVDKKYS